MDEDRRVIRDKILKRISELFPAGAGDEGIRDELAVVVPSISIEDIQRLRKQLGAKAAADKEMLGSIEELEDAPIMSYREIAEANERWNRMMIYYECRKDFNTMDKARVMNVVHAEHEQRRRERR